jgi:hypothetical protein
VGLVSCQAASVAPAPDCSADGDHSRSHTGMEGTCVIGDRTMLHLPSCKVGCLTAKCLCLTRSQRAPQKQNWAPSQPAVRGHCTCDMFHRAPTLHHPVLRQSSWTVKGQDLQQGHQVQPND